MTYSRSVGPGGESQSEVFALHAFTAAAGETLPYRFHRPAGDDGAARRHPLVLLLHGAGERGHDNRRQLTHGARALVAWITAHEVPTIVVAPQCPAGEQWVDVPWSAEAHTMPTEPSRPMRLAMGLLDELLVTWPVDRRRVYLTGLSMGGFGAWDLAQRRPDLFAALLPVCGGGDTAEVAKLVDLPTWAFHGEKDSVVPVSRSRAMVAAIEAAGGRPRYTEYAGVGHDAWTRTYGDPAVLAWLFGQARPEEDAEAEGGSAGADGGPT